MSPVHILLRFVLCISLIFNGSGIAVAATWMQMGHAHLEARSAPASATRPAAAMPVSCHEMPGMKTPATPGAVAAIDGDTAATIPGDGSPTDCCLSAHCNASCAQQAQVATAAVAMATAAAGHCTDVCPMTSGHTSPALAHVIRPPIG